MKLELASLRAVGCGPLKDVCIDFRDDSGQVRPVTVLAGANGSGKTTVLELISAMFGAIPSGRVDGILMRANYVQMDLEIDDILHNITSTDPSKSEGMLAKPLMGSPALDQFVRGWDRQSGQVIDFEDRSMFSSATESLLPSLLYFPHNRILRAVMGDQMNREEIRYQWVYRYETVPSFKGSFDSYLAWLEYAHPETFTLVIEYLNSLFTGKTFSMNRHDIKAVANLPDGSKHFLEELSSGEQNILIMLLELRRRLLPHSIVLIDEIESSLHRAFQHKLAQALLRMQKQIPFQLIVTTHSTDIAEAFGWDSVLILTEF